VNLFQGVRDPNIREMQMREQGGKDKLGWGRTAIYMSALEI